MSLSRSQTRKILKARVGELARLARELGVTPTTVSQVLKGRATSARIMAAASERAAELEQQTATDAAA